MSRTWLIFVCVGMCCVWVHAGSLNMDWVYHDDADDIDDRVAEHVPGELYTFVGNGFTIVSNDEAVVLYVLTANQFAGDQEEQVFVRWWNGEEEHWIMGSWEKNISLGESALSGGSFHGMPTEGNVILDVWKIEIGPEMTKPGENFYVIQLKGWGEGQATEHYATRDQVEGGSQNELGQAWTGEANYFGHDWSLTIKD